MPRLLLLGVLTGTTLALTPWPWLPQLPPQLHINHRLFADALTNLLYNKGGTPVGDFTSALGVSMAFSMVYPSMTGDSLNQTQYVLGYPANSNNQLVWASATSDLVGLYAGQCLHESQGECQREQPTVEISNKIWVDSAFTVDPNFAAIVGTTMLEHIPFADQSSGDQVNAWVDDATNGLINSIVDPGPLSPLVIFAVNAMYLKASWYFQFMEDKTNQDVFYTLPSKTTPTSQEANFMHQVDYFMYSDEVVPGFQIVQLPFVDPRLSLVIALPLSDDSGEVTSYDIVDRVIPMLQSHRLALALPKFVIEMTYLDNLKTSLQSLGIVEPFSSGGLCIFLNDCSTTIDFIIQKTFIRVDEEGVEAAAVTGIAGIISLPTDQPIEVLADHPFQFYIFEEATQLVLFEGRLDNPGLQQATAELTARHNNDDFWLVNFGVEPEIVETTASTPSATAPTRIPNTSVTQPLLKPESSTSSLRLLSTLILGVFALLLVHD